MRSFISRILWALEYWRYERKYWKDGKYHG